MYLPPSFPLRTHTSLLFRVATTGIFRISREGKRMKCRPKVKKGEPVRISRASTTKSLHPYFQKAASRKSAASEWLESDSTRPSSFFSSFLSGAECLKPVKWAVSLFSLLLLLRFADFLALSLSLSLTLQAELGCRGCFLLMASSFSRGSRRFFWDTELSCGCRKF